MTRIYRRPSYPPSAMDVIATWSVMIAIASVIVALALTGG